MYLLPGRSPTTLHLSVVFISRFSAGYSLLQWLVISRGARVSCQSRAGCVNRYTLRVMTTPPTGFADPVRPIFNPYFSAATNSQNHSLLRHHHAVFHVKQSCFSILGDIQQFLVRRGYHHLRAHLVQQRHKLVAVLCIELGRQIIQ